ncbi:MAG: hypothetical protein RL513_2164 [Pseudomonadota bacterium]|jgi:hypothetical protein
MSRSGPHASADADAAQRLARTRLAILEYLQQRQHGPASSAGGDTPPPYAQDSGAGWRGLRDAVRGHWQGQRAPLLVRLATPLLAHWGRHHPLALIGIAAAAGVLLVLARPWRMVSVTGLVLAALKSPYLASLAMNLLASGRPGLRRRPRP